MPLASTRIPPATVSIASPVPVVPGPMVVTRRMAALDPRRSPPSSRRWTRRAQERIERQPATLSALPPLIDRPSWRTLLLGVAVREGPARGSLAWRDSRRRRPDHRDRLGRGAPGRRGDRLRRRHRDRRTGQHPPPPLPVAHPRPSDQLRPVRMAPGALPDLGAHLGRGRRGRGDGRPGRARAERGDDGGRPPLRRARTATTRSSTRSPRPAGKVGVRLHLSRGSMDLGESAGGLAARRRGREHRGDPGVDRGGGGPAARR